MLELLKQFIPVADKPERYRGMEPARQKSLEYQLLYDAMLQTGFRNGLLKAEASGRATWHVQGMYVITPSGKVIAGGNQPMNPEFALHDMRKGLEIYAKIPREERLLSRAPGAKKDRMFPERDRPRAPADGLVLRVAGRGLEEKVSKWCELSPTYHIIDRLWYTRDEAMQLLPVVLRVGERKQITGPVLDGLARLHLVGAPYSSWTKADVKELQLTSEVTDVQDRIVSLKMSGRVVLDADDTFNRQKYRPDLLGYATYDTEKQRFTRFEMLAYGMHTIEAKHMAPGGPAWTPMGFLLTLNGLNVNDDQPPQKLQLYRGVGLQSGR